MVLVKVTVVLHKVTVGVPGDLNILQAMFDKESTFCIYASLKVLL